MSDFLEGRRALRRFKKNGGVELPRTVLVDNKHIILNKSLVTRKRQSQYDDCVSIAGAEVCSILEKKTAEHELELKRRRIPDALSPAALIRKSLTSGKSSSFDLISDDPNVEDLRLPDETHPSMIADVAQLCISEIIRAELEPGAITAWVNYYVEMLKGRSMGGAQIDLWTAMEAIKYAEHTLIRIGNLQPSYVSQAAQRMSETLRYKVGGTGSTPAEGLSLRKSVRQDDGLSFQGKISQDLETSRYKAHWQGALAELRAFNDGPTYTKPQPKRVRMKTGKIGNRMGTGTAVFGFSSIRQVTRRSLGLDIDG